MADQRESDAMTKPIANTSYDKRKEVKLARAHVLCGIIAIKYGGYQYGDGSIQNLYTADRIKECWLYPDEPMPTPHWLKERVRVIAVKEYIEKHLDLTDPIWNADFIHGLFKHGTISWTDSSRKHRFPTFSWDYRHFTLTQLIQTFPYGGAKSIWEGKLRGVPAICVRHREDTIPFISGVLSVGSLIEIDGKDYAKYGGNTVPYIRKWEIPVEMDLRETKEILISPFWPALFALHMPDLAAKRWMNISNPCKANIYSAVLWKIYCDNDFPADAMPYLISKRKIRSDFKTADMSGMKHLERMRVTHGLTGLDNRIGDMAKEWKKEYTK